MKNCRPMTLNWILPLMLMLGGSSAALAKEGGATSGGGGAHVCFDAEGSIQSVEMYDLYEGREVRGLQIISEQGKSANELLAQALQKIWEVNPILADSILEQIKFYVSHRKVVSGKRVTELQDAKTIFVDEGCEYRQLAQWRDDFNAVYVDASLKEKFDQSALNQAALALHEGIYAVERKRGATDSVSTRRLVAEAFSNQPVQLQDTAYEKNPDAVQHLLRAKSLKRLPLDRDSSLSLRVKVGVSDSEGTHSRERARTKDLLSSLFVVSFLDASSKENVIHTREYFSTHQDRSYDLASPILDRMQSGTSAAVVWVKYVETEAMGSGYDQSQFELQTEWLNRGQGVPGSWNRSLTLGTNLEEKFPSLRLTQLTQVYLLVAPYDLVREQVQDLALE